MEYWDTQLRQCKLTLDKTVECYAQRIESLVSRRFPSSSDRSSHVIERFIDGLPDVIQYEVQSRYPTTIEYAIRRAKIEWTFPKKSQKGKIAHTQKIAQHGN
jgi:hypothetical protein